MSERFSETQMLHLAEIYRDYDCLWNVQSELYKDRFARDSAYQNILERLNIPGLSVKDIPKKIKNLRSSYYQEIKRIQNSKRSGAQDAVYRPKVSWFSTVEGFLKPFRNKRETYSYNDKDSNSASDNEMETQNTKSTDVKNENPEVVLNSVDEPIEVDWDLTSHPPPGQREQNETSNTYFIVPSKKPTKKGKIDKKDDDIHYAIAKIDKIADNLTKSATSLIERQEDEFDTFGKHVAMSLRSLPRELAVVGQTDIQKVISDMQLRALRQQLSSQNSEPTLLSFGTATVKLEYA